MCIGPELQESDPTVAKSLDERVDEGEQGHQEAETETEQASEAQEDAEPDSGLGESSVEGGEGQIHCKHAFYHMKIGMCWYELSMSQ